MNTIINHNNNIIVHRRDFSEAIYVIFRGEPKLNSRYIG